jgi:hypothetical protein
MKRFMVIEHFAAGNLDRVYQRFHAKGRMLPPGLLYIDSWLESSGLRCFQLMETDNSADSAVLFEAWTACWRDLVTFEIVELRDKPKATQ